MAKKKCRIIAAALIALAVVSYGGTALAAAVKSNGWFYEEVSATDTNQYSTLSIAGFAPGGVNVTVYNEGANEIYVALDEAATTSKIYIGSGATLDFGDALITKIGIICDTGETATVRVYGRLKN